MEAEVFAEIKNVEKLLTLLSTSNTAPREEDNEEISVGVHHADVLGHLLTVTHTETLPPNAGDTPETHQAD